MNFFRERINEKSTALSLRLSLRLGSGKPGIKIRKKQSAPLKRCKHARLIILDSLSNLPDLTESNNYLQILLYVYFIKYVCFFCFLNRILYKPKKNISKDQTSSKKTYRRLLDSCKSVCKITPTVCQKEAQENISLCYFLRLSLKQTD